MPFIDYFPPAPPLTDENLPSQAGRVFIITGASGGVGFELAKILYSKGGIVHVMGRSSSRAEEAIAKIEAMVPKSKQTGRLESMVFDLADLKTIKPAVQKFLEMERRLDVLVHNAGIMMPPPGSKSAQGSDLEMSTHCLGPFLLTSLLEDTMKKTAAITSNEAYKVRIVWVATILGLSTPAGGMQFDEQGVPKVLKVPMENYVESKIGGVWLANDFAERLDKYGIMSLSIHPGMVKTDLQRHMPAPVRAIMRMVFKKPVWGAYTELFGGFSPDLNSKHNGGYIMAWGRVVELPSEVRDGLKGNGNGNAAKFLMYCVRETKTFL